MTSERVSSSHVQDRVVNDEREHQSTFGSHQKEADGHCPSVSRVASEQVVMKDASRGPLPLVETEDHDHRDANDKRSQDHGIGPVVETFAQIRADHEQGQTDGEESRPHEVQAAQLLQEAQVVVLCVSLRRPITEKYAQRGESPETHFNPLKSKGKEANGVSECGTRISQW